MEQAQSIAKKPTQQNIKKNTENKATKKDATKTAKNKTAKKEVKKAKENKTTEEKVKKEYFGHKEDADIWQSLLVNKLIAHRGVHDKDVPENSLLAFQKAIEKGYAIELDVNPLADGTPVVFHDSKMSRMTGKDKYIQNLTKEELSQITLLNSTEKIPTLKEVLKFGNGKTPLLIEIKHQEKVGDLEKQVWELLKDYKGEYAIQSFNPFTLKWFYDNAPKVWRGQLSSYFKGEQMNFIKKSVLKRLALTKIAHQDFVSYNIKDLPNRYTRRLTVPLLTWTIETNEQYLKALQITDNVIFQGFEPTV